MPFSLPAGGRLAALALSLTVALGSAPAAADPAPPFGPQAPQNPATAANGTATMHGDSASSGTTPHPGPGTSAVKYSRTALASACPTVVVGSDGYVITLCTSIFGQTPTVHLLDPATGADLASLALPKGSLFGGVYAYLDNADRLVVVDGNNNLVRVGHHRTDSGWTLRTEQSTPLGDAVPAGDNIVGLTPDWQGKVWFATSGGVIGTVDTGTGAVRAISTGEGVQNSISTVPGRTAVATDHALYLLSAGPDGTPVVDWRAPYDRGPARKPGQLSWGTGTTPSFFGPGSGTEYVTIVDNAAPHGNLLVYRANGGPDPICRIPVLTQYARSGTEDAVIASGRSVFVTNTYGYPYPALPEGAPASQPSSANFDGGLSRIDVDAEGTGCSVVWNSPVKSAALPRLSLADGKIYTVSVTGPTGSAGLNTFAQYHHSVIDPATGAQLTSSYLGIGLVYNPLQMRGTATPDGTLYQGTETGVVRISRR
ncbi:streptogramin lyase [Streptomyces filamentosus]